MVLKSFFIKQIVYNFFRYTNWIWHLRQEFQKQNKKKTEEPAAEEK